jgi:hypothetical protein
MILIYLTFSFAPITMLLGTIRRHLLSGQFSIARETGGIFSKAEPAVKKLDDVQTTSLSRSRAVARTASTRPQVLLFVGALIAFGGLIFFVVTLPQEVNPLSPTLRVSSNSPLVKTQAEAMKTAEQLAALSPDERNAL